MTHKGSLVKRANSPFWYMRVMVDGVDKWKSTGMRNKRDAEKVLADWVAPYNAADRVAALKTATEQAANKHGAILVAGMRLDEVWQCFVDSPERPDSGAATLHVYHFQWNQFHKWVGERYPKMLTLSGVTPEVAALYARELARNLSASTYNKHRNLLKLIWKVMARRLKGLENPWDALPPKRAVPVSRRELTTDELKRILKQTTGEMKVLFTLGIYTGLRLGDCCTLRWEEIDFGLLLIRRIPNKTSRKTRQIVSIPIHRMLLKILEEIQNGQMSGPVLPDLDKTYRKTPDVISKRIRIIFDAVEIQRTGEKPSPGKRVKSPTLAGFHSLRHTFVSICRSAGVPLAIVEAIVGHSNPAMTRHYTHIGDEAARAAVSLLPDIEADEATLIAPASIPGKEPPGIDWIREQLTGMNSRNWRETRAVLLARCVTHQNNES